MKRSFNLAGLGKLEKLTHAYARRPTGREFGKSAWLASVKHADFLNSKLDDDALRVPAICPRLVHLDERDGRAARGACPPAMTHCAQRQAWLGSPMSFIDQERRGTSDNCSYFCSSEELALECDLRDYTSPSSPGEALATNFRRQHQRLSRVN